jgi:ribosomal protein L11 methylase PrmA
MQCAAADILSCRPCPGCCCCLSAAAACLLLLPVCSHAQVLDPTWFQGADVLDVGCNEGLVSLALAVHCGCRSVTGVDIDPVLVSKACTNLSRSRSQLNQQLHQAVRDR